MLLLLLTLLIILCYNVFCIAAFLLNGPADPTLPCILEVDCFQMLINLHFSVSTLFLSVSNACGRCSALETDPTLLPLMGLTDAHLIKLTAAAHMLQFLLTCSTLAADEQQSSQSCLRLCGDVCFARECVT